MADAMGAGRQADLARAAWRGVALAFVPGLATMVLFAVSVLRHIGTKPGTAGVQLLIAVAFFLADLLYLYLARRTLADGGAS